LEDQTLPLSYTQKRKSEILSTQYEQWRSNTCFINLFLRVSGDMEKNLKSKKMKYTHVKSKKAASESVIVDMKSVFALENRWKRPKNIW